MDSRPEYVGIPKKRIRFNQTYLVTLAKTIAAIHRDLRTVRVRVNGKWALRYVIYDERR